MTQKLPPGSITLSDNCKTHWADGIRATLHRAQICTRETPPYSPWFQPAEVFFHAWKTELRLNRDAYSTLIVQNPEGGVETALRLAAMHVDANQFAGFYRKCGLNKI